MRRKRHKVQNHYQGIKQELQSNTAKYLLEFLYLTANSTYAVRKEKASSDTIIVEKI